MYIYAYIEEIYRQKEKETVHGQYISKGRVLLENPVVTRV